MKPKLILCLALVLSGGLFGCQIRPISSLPPAESHLADRSLYSFDVLEILRKDLQKGTPEQKEHALEVIMKLRAISLLPEVMEAIEDPTPLPQHDDTGWGFVGHEAATAMSTIAEMIDGIDLKQRGYRAYSFNYDQGDGGAKLKATGRLAEVRRNWEKWWQDQSRRK